MTRIYAESRLENSAFICVAIRVNLLLQNMFSSKKKFAKTTTLIVIIALALIFLNFIGLLPLFNDFIGRPLGLAQRWLYGLGIGIADTQQRALSKSELLDLNKDLKDQILVLTKKVAELKIFEEENKELVQQLDFLKQHNYRAVTARVIGRSPDYGENILIINCGGQDGLAIGYPVIAEEGVIIGKIIGVSQHNAKVMLLSDSHSKTAAAILNSDRTVGIVEGQYGLSIKMALIPQNEEVKAGDIVVTSGLEENIPKGLLIAKVDHLITQSNDVFQSAILNFLMDYNKVSIVSVLLP